MDPGEHCFTPLGPEILNQYPVFECGFRGMCVCVCVLERERERKKCSVYVGFIDLEKAYDRVNREAL